MFNGRVSEARLMFNGSVYEAIFMFNESVYEARFLFNGSVYEARFMFNGSVYEARCMFNGPVSEARLIFNGSVYEAMFMFNGSVYKARFMLLGLSHTCGPKCVLLYDHLAAFEISSSKIAKAINDLRLHEHSVINRILSILNITLEFCQPFLRYKILEVTGTLNDLTTTLKNLV